MRVVQLVIFELFSGLFLGFGVLLRVLGPVTILWVWSGRIADGSGAPWGGARVALDIFFNSQRIDSALQEALQGVALLRECTRAL